MVSGFTTFLTELKRRRVFRVAVATFQHLRRPHPADGLRLPWPGIAAYP